MMIDVALLGTGGTMPLPDRFLSSLLVRFSGRLILVDCGEGTQVSLRKLGWGIKDIGTILITHFHADHVAGLPGLLLTIGNSGRTREEPLTIAGPRGVQRVCEALRVIAPHLPYPIKYREMSGEGDDPVAVGDLSITSCRADHDAVCLAWRFDLPRAPRFQPEKAKALGLPVQFWKVLQRGSAVEYEGRTIDPSQVLGAARAGLSVGFLTDSRPTERLTNFLSDLDLLVCEATYGDPADYPKAVENKHMTFAESAGIGVRSRAKRLWLTHFSPALPNPDYFRREATAIYPDVVLGREHLDLSLVFDDE